jgi:hypothetical protein
MKPDIFYPRVRAIFGEAPEERHRRMALLDAEVLEGYLGWVRAIPPEAAARPCAEGRTLAQVVGHIMEWDRYLAISAGEMLAGVEWPGIMSKERYVETDGRTGGYETMAEFNARQAAKHADWPWPKIRTMAEEIAEAVHALFTAPGVLTPRRLEATRPYAWRVPDGDRLTIGVGWYLWMVVLEHEGVEHEQELAPGTGA